MKLFTDREGRGEGHFALYWAQSLLKIGQSLPPSGASSFRFSLDFLHKIQKSFKSSSFYFPSHCGRPPPLLAPPPLVIPDRLTVHALLILFDWAPCGPAWGWGSATETRHTVHGLHTQRRGGIGTRERSMGVETHSPLTGPNPPPSGIEGSSVDWSPLSWPPTKLLG